MKTDIYKKKLEEELVALEKELGTVGVRNSSNPDDWVAIQPEENIAQSDENEVADTMDDYENNMAILRDLKIRYRNVKLALDKIEKGTYGICEVNNHPISEKRLLANPSARTCREHLNENLK